MLNMSEQKYTWSEVRCSPVDNSKPAGFNWLSQLWTTLIVAQQIDALVRIMDARIDKMVDLSPNARSGYVVARNLIDKARVEVQYANRRAMQEVKAVKEVSR